MNDSTTSTQVTHCFKFKRKIKVPQLIYSQNQWNVSLLLLLYVVTLQHVVSFFADYGSGCSIEAFTPRTFYTTSSIVYKTKRQPFLHLAASNNKSSSSNPSSPSSKPDETNYPFQKRSKKWLIVVDDEESIRLSLGNFLYNAGYSVTACADAEALLEILTSISQGGGGGGISNNTDTDDDGISTFYEDRFPNVIICDIRMPGEGMDGLDLLTILKNPPPSSSSLPSSSVMAGTSIVPLPLNDVIMQSSNDWDFIRQQWKRIPVILLTAKSLTQDRIEGYRRGADVYLPKPFNPEELLSIVDNLIERTEILTGSNYRNNDNGKRSPSLRDLKGDILEIKGILREKKKSRRLLRASAGTSTNTAENDNKLIGRPISSPSPPSSALVPLSKIKRLGESNVNGAIIPQSEIDAFNARVQLTPSEKNILNLVSQGYTNKEIAKRIGNSTSTTSVSRTISNLYSKTFTKTRTELVKWGMRMGYIAT